MAKMITDMNEIDTQDENDLLVIYDKLQERTSTIKASKFRGGITHISVNAVATPPVEDMTDAMFTDLLIKPNDFWRDDTTAIDGSYREYQALTVDYNTNRLTWGDPVLYTPRTPFVFPAGEQATDYAPPTDQADALYGGITIIAGDRVRWQVAGSTTGKETITSKCIVNADDSIDWGANQNPRPTLTHNSGVLTHPVLNDADYSVGDFIIGNEGNRYGPYIEGESDDLVAWPLQRQREPHRYTLDVADDEAAQDQTALNALIATWEPYPFEGDTLLLSIPASSKQYLYTIARMDPLEDQYRPASGLEVRNPLNPNALMHYNASTNTWPERDDNRYSRGDTFTIGVDMTFGPYMTGRTNDPHAWPLLRRRAPRDWNLFEEVGIELGGNSDTYGFDISSMAGFMHDDTLTLQIVTGKRVRYDVLKVVNDDEDYLPASGFKLMNRRNPDVSVTRRSDHAGWPEMDDEIVSVGDYHRTSNGNIFGPYIEGQPIDMLAWFIHTIRPVTTHRRDLADEAAIQAFEYYMLPWPIDGDKVIFTLPTGKIVEYDIHQVTATDDPFMPDDGFEFVNRRNGRNSIFHNSGTDGQPARNDDLYGTGDSIISTDGKIYGPYVEGQATDALAAPFLVNMAAAAATGNPILTQEGTGTKFILGLQADGKFFREEQ